jgi:uncharacterized protein YaaN involved in tellurite resistance
LDNNGNIDLSQYQESELVKYKSISTSLDIKDSSTIINFGADIQSKMGQYSDNFLTRVRTFDSGEVGGYITSLLTEINQIDVDKIEQGTFKRILRRIPIVKSLLTSIEKMFQQYDTVSANVEKIANKVNLGRINSLKDNAALQTIFDSNITFIGNIEELIIAAQLKYDEIKAEVAKMETERDKYQDYEIADRQDFLHRLDRRLGDMKTVRFIMIQSLAQIRVVQSTNLTVAEKAQTIITTTIPVWKQQLTLAVALERQRANIEVQKKVTDATNEMLLKNSKMLKQNSISAARESERAVVDVTTLRQTTQDLIETLTEVKRIHNEGEESRKTLNKDLAALETELKKNVTSN